MKKLFKNQIRTIRSLQTKKGREENGLFLVEGIKAVTELLDSELATQYLVTDTEFRKDGQLKDLISKKKIEVYSADTGSVSSLESGEGVLAVARMPERTDRKKFFGSGKDLIALFGIGDPGNVGTLLRTALWFNFGGVILIGDCADVYSPKVVRGSMGAVFRISVLKASAFEEVAGELEGSVRIGTFLDSEHDFDPAVKGRRVLFLGNESAGLDRGLKKYTDMNYRILSGSGFDSLNVSVAGGIIMHELFRIGR